MLYLIMFHRPHDGHGQPQGLSRISVCPQSLDSRASRWDVFLPQELTVLVHFWRRRRHLIIVVERRRSERRYDDVLQNVFQLHVIPVHMQRVDCFVEDCSRPTLTFATRFGRNGRVRTKNRRLRSRWRVGRSSSFGFCRFGLAFVIFIFVVVAWVFVGIELKILRLI